MTREALHMGVRMALIPQISRQNYDTLAKQLREVIANAMDAKASRINIEVRQIGASSNYKTQLIIEDDGYGMTVDEFKQDYLGVGGSWKEGDPNTIGRIGIGSLAVAVLGRKLRVETRKKDSDQVLIADLWVGESVRGIERTEEVQDVTVGEIKEVRQATENDMPSFTRLTLFDVYDDTAVILNDKNRFKRVVDELEKTLPLEYPDEHPLLMKMQADLREILLDPNRLSKMEVLVTAPCLGPGARKLERYAYGHLSREEEKIAGFPFPITPIQVAGGTKEDLTVFGYFVDAGHNLPEDRQGIVVRVKNMGVELNSFFESDDTAANARITGELFIENLDEQYAMTINRNELVKEHHDYIAVRDNVLPLLKDFIKDVRGRVATNSQIKKHVDRIKGVRDAFVKVGEALTESGLDLSNMAPEQSSVLADAEDVDVMDEIREIDESIVVYSLPTITKNHDIKHIDDEVEVTVNEELLNNTIIIGDREFYYYLKHGKPEDPPCEIHLDKDEIYVNVGNPILSSRGDQIIRAVIALRFAYLESKGDADRLYDLTLAILGKAFEK